VVTSLQIRLETWAENLLQLPALIATSRTGRNARDRTAKTLSLHCHDPSEGKEGSGGAAKEGATER